MNEYMNCEIHGKQFDVTGYGDCEQCIIEYGKEQEAILDDEVRQRVGHIPTNEFKEERVISHARELGLIGKAYQEGQKFTDEQKQVLFKFISINGHDVRALIANGFKLNCDLFEEEYTPAANAIHQADHFEECNVNNYYRY